MSLPGIVEVNVNDVDDPSVGKSPLLSVTLCHVKPKDKVSNTLPSAATKSYISLAGNVPISISVLSYVKLKFNLVMSDIGYPNWTPKPFELVK